MNHSTQTSWKRIPTYVIQGWFDEYKFEKGKDSDSIERFIKDGKVSNSSDFNEETLKEILIDDKKHLLVFGLHLVIWLDRRASGWRNETRFFIAAMWNPVEMKLPKYSSQKKIKRGRYDLLIQFLPLFLGNCVQRITCIFSWNRPHAEMETFTSEKTWEFP